MPAALRSAWIRGSRNDRNETPALTSRRRRTGDVPAGQDPAQQTEQTQQTAEVTQASNGGVLSSMRGALRFGRRRQPQENSEALTPSQLEAANRTPAAT
jgi:hypothetical protein